MTVSQFSIRASSGKLTKGELEVSLQALKEIDDEVASRKLASNIPSFFYQASSQPAQSTSNKKYDLTK